MSDRIKTNPFVRVRPHLYAEPPRFVAKDLVTHDSTKLKDHRLLELMDVASEFVERQQVVRVAGEIFEYGPDRAGAVVSSLEDRNVLIGEGSEHHELERDASSWLDDGWDEALAYHVGMRDVLSDLGSISDDEEKANRMREMDLPIYREYPAAETVSLPDPDEYEFDASIGDALYAGSDGDDARRDREPMDREFLSTLLQMAFGQMDEVYFEDVGPFVKKTSPSGGAWHPTEVYLLASERSRLPSDLYHYSVKRHCLERLSTTEDVGPSAVANLQSLFEREQSGRGPEFVLLFTSVVDRNMIKYRDPRTFRVVQQDVGHLVETLRLLCRSESRRVDVRSDRDVAEIERHLGVDTLEEPVFGYAELR